MSSHLSGRQQQRWIGRLPSIGIDQVAVGDHLIVGCEYSLRAAAQKLRAIGAVRACHLIEPVNQFVVELDEHFAPGHDQMVSHMV
jgi:hypothetical protein